MFVFKRSKLIELMTKSFGVVKYKLGAKPKLTAIPPKNFTASDCSGYVRWLLYNLSDGKLTLPLGSWYQEHWCKANLKTCDYKTAANIDNILRIAFCGTTSRHVWLVLNGQTIECYGGYGAGRRSWKTLANRNPRCYIVGKMIP